MSNGPDVVTALRAALAETHPNLTSCCFKLR